jgi:hypothetical protein
MIFDLTGLDGNIYVCGNTTGSIKGQNNNGGTNYFLAKYDPNGNLIWIEQFHTQSFRSHN